VTFERIIHCLLALQACLQPFLASIYCSLIPSYNPQTPFRPPQDPLPIHTTYTPSYIDRPHPQPNLIPLRQHQLLPPHLHAHNFDMVQRNLVVAIIIIVLFVILAAIGFAIFFLRERLSGVRTRVVEEED